jgi:hypothetical protein
MTCLLCTNWRAELPAVGIARWTVSLVGGVTLPMPMTIMSTVTVSKEVHRDHGDENEQEEPVFSEPAHKSMVVRIRRMR